jgi:hypothetical protein
VVDLNYLAMLAATIAVFVVSSVYYVMLSGRLAQLSPAYADASSPRPWEIALELARSFVVAAVVAGLVAVIGIRDVPGAALLALALWIGFPVVLLSGAVIHEGVPWRLATIHTGDWLLKLLVIGVIVTVWR